MDFFRSGRNPKLARLLGVLVFVTDAFGKKADDQAAAAAASTSAAAGCAVCSTFLFIPIAFLVISVMLLVWVARDAKARGMDSAVLWMLLVFFLNLLGLLIYVLARPQGNLIQCPNCGNKRLQASVKCPHCGA